MLIDISIIQVQEKLEEEPSWSIRGLRKIRGSLNNKAKLVKVERA